MQSRLAGPILILLSALCFSVTGTLQALAPAGATPWVIAEVRMVTSAFFLFLWCAATGKLPKLTADLPWRAIIICACCTCLYQLFFFFGALKLGVAVGTVVCVGATPIMSAIVAKFVLGHSPRPIWYVATLIAVVGIGLLNIKSFEAGNLEVVSSSVSDIVNFVASSENGTTFSLDIIRYTSADYLSGTQFEKDTENIEQYSNDQQTFYILSNVDTITATWSDGLIVEQITGNISDEYMKKIIDSIGGV